MRSLLSLPRLSSARLSSARHLWPAMYRTGSVTPAGQVARQVQARRVTNLSGWMRGRQRAGLADPSCRNRLPMTVRRRGSTLGPPRTTPDRWRLWRSSGDRWRGPPGARRPGRVRMSRTCRPITAVAGACLGQTAAKGSSRTNVGQRRCPRRARRRKRSVDYVFGDRRFADGDHDLRRGQVDERDAEDRRIGSHRGRVAGTVIVGGEGSVHGWHLSVRIGLLMGVCTVGIGRCRVGSRCRVIWR